MSQLFGTRILMNKTTQPYLILVAYLRPSSRDLKSKFKISRRIGSLIRNCGFILLRTTAFTLSYPAIFQRPIETLKLFFIKESQF